MPYHFAAAARFVGFLLALSTLCIDSLDPDENPHPGAAITLPTASWALWYLLLRVSTGSTFLVFTLTSPRAGVSPFPMLPLCCLQNSRSS